MSTGEAGDSPAERSAQGRSLCPSNTGVRASTVRAMLKLSGAGLGSLDGAVGLVIADTVRPARLTRAACGWPRQVSGVEPRVAVAPAPRPAPPRPPPAP